jgi:hypothetical protein
MNFFEVLLVLMGLAFCGLLICAVYKDGVVDQQATIICAPMIKIGHFTYNNHKYAICPDVNNTPKFVEIK